MNTDLRLFSRRSSAHTAWSSTWTHVLIWLLLAVAALLLVGFTAVVNDITERGEQRRVQQRLSGALLPSGEMQVHGVDTVRLLSMTGEKLARR
jgi:hypothetical protein